MTQKKKKKSLSFLFFPQELLQQFVVLSKGSIPSRQAWVRLGQSIIDPMEWVTLKLLSGADWQVIFVDQHADGTLMSWPVPKSARSSIAP